MNNFRGFGSRFQNSRNRNRTSNVPIPISINPQPPSLASTITTVDAQDLCPLFNGYIPTEIRDLIFSYVLTESNALPKESDLCHTINGVPVPPQQGSTLAQIPNVDGQKGLKGGISEWIYEPDSYFTRPGYTGKSFLSLSLLRTCKLAYLSLHLEPAKRKEHVFWHHCAPPGLNGPLGNEVTYLKRFNEETLAGVKEIHMFTQQFWLEDRFPELSQEGGQLGVMKGIEKLTITLRRSDWWSWEGNNLQGM
jgi:hypothetical protein